jgi:hypothetical protein
LVALQLVLFAAQPTPVERDVAAPTAAPVVASPDPIPVGRDPFASPFGAKGKGEEHGGVLVQPPGVVRHGDDVTAATTVVNESKDRWLPPSPVTFVARDATGEVIATTTATVTLGPGRSEMVIAPDLGVDPATIAAIEAHIDAAPLRTGRYRPPNVRVASADVTEGGKSIEGTLDVAPHANGSPTLACVIFDTLDEMTGVGSTTIDLGKATNGHLRFWMTAQTDTEGPHHVSCAVA